MTRAEHLQSVFLLDIGLHLFKRGGGVNAFGAVLQIPRPVLEPFSSCPRQQARHGWRCKRGSKKLDECPLIHTGSDVRIQARLDPPEVVTCRCCVFIVCISSDPMVMASFCSRQEQRARRCECRLRFRGRYFPLISISYSVIFGRTLTNYRRESSENRCHATPSFTNCVDWAGWPVNFAILD